MSSVRRQCVPDFVVGRPEDEVLENVAKDPEEEVGQTLQEIHGLRHPFGELGVESGCRWAAYQGAWEAANSSSRRHEDLWHPKQVGNDHASCKALCQLVQSCHVAICSELLQA